MEESLMEQVSLNSKILKDTVTNIFSDFLLNKVSKDYFSFPFSFSLVNQNRSHVTNT